MSVTEEPTRTTAQASALAVAVEPFSFTILSGRDAPSTARLAAELRTRTWIEPRAAEDLALALNEVVINAVRHGIASGAAPITIEGAVFEGSLCIEVTNIGPRFERVPNEPVRMEHDGRGLEIVEAVAARWGAHHEDGHTTVWFELDL